MKLKRTGFQGGKSALIVSMMKYQEMEGIMENKDISVNPAERLLLISHSLQSIIVRKMLSNGCNMPRKSHKRGVKGSFSRKTEKRKRGISKEQVCVLCAMDRIGLEKQYMYKLCKIFVIFKLYDI